MLRIRLTRTGKKHQPTYRIVVAEHSSPIKGKFIEIVGYYLADRKPKVLEVKADRVHYWLERGAQASDTVHNLLVDKKILTEKRNIKYSRIKEEKKEKAPAATTLPEEKPEASIETPADSEPTASEPETEATEHDQAAETPTESDSAQ